VDQKFKRKFEIEISLLEDEGGIPGAFESENDPDEEPESEELGSSTSARIARLRERCDLEMEGFLELGSLIGPSRRSGRLGRLAGR
jgi:hypothetical protein